MKTHVMIATWKMSMDGCRKAWPVLCEENDRKQALSIAIRDVEDNPEYHYVGYGGYPNSEGVVETDGAYMDGNSMRFGAVAGVSGIRNPILLAMKLSDHTKDCFLCGEGAVKYALEHGLEKADLLSEEMKETYAEHESHDTVCMIAKDSDGMSVGVSTFGLPYKHPGRVGDSPVVGSGFY